MQDNREQRSFGAGKAYQFMMRTRQPGGRVTNQLYLTMDDLADQFGNGTLRLTTRQAYQLHGVLKHDLKTVFSSVVKAMGTTLGACGDVNRNVMSPPPPYKNKPEYLIAEQARPHACCCHSRTCAVGERRAASPTPVSSAAPLPPARRGRGQPACPPVGRLL